eukprot:567415-Amorphochlora_amoeboformis.AAC.2
MKSDDGDKSGIDYWFYQPNHKHVVELARPRHRETGVGGTYAQASSSTGEGLGEDGVQFLGISSPMRITAIPSNTVVGSGSSGTSRSVESSRAEAKTADASKTAADSNWRRRTDGLFAQPKNIKRSSRLNSDPSEIVPPSPASQPISDILPDSKRIFRKDKCNNLLLVSTPIIGVRSPNIFDSPVLVSNENFDKMRQAVCEGDLQALRGFKPSKLEANYADRDGNCLLILASYYGHASCIMGLVEMQADVNQSNKSGSSPTSDYLRGGYGPLGMPRATHAKRVLKPSIHPRMILNFANLRASISTPDNSGMTPLMWATEKVRNSDANPNPYKTLPPDTSYFPDIVAGKSGLRKAPASEHKGSLIYPRPPDTKESRCQREQQGWCDGTDACLLRWAHHMRA